MWTVEKIVVFVKILDHYHYKFNFGNSFSCPVKLNQDLIMILLILAICKVLFEMLYTILR